MLQSGRRGREGLDAHRLSEVHRAVPLLLIEIPGLPSLTVLLTVKSLRPATDCHPFSCESNLHVGCPPPTYWWIFNRVLPKASPENHHDAKKAKECQVSSG